MDLQSAVQFGMKSIQAGKQDEAACLPIFISKFGLGERLLCPVMETDQAIGKAFHFARIRWQATCVLYARHNASNEWFSQSCISEPLFDQCCLKRRVYVRQAPDVTAEFVEVFFGTGAPRVGVISSRDLLFDGTLNLTLINSQNEYTAAEAKIDFDPLQQAKGGLGMTAVKIVDDYNKTIIVSGGLHLVALGLGIFGQKLVESLIQQLGGGLCR